MRTKSWSLVLGPLLASTTFFAHAANDGELWEVTSQRAIGDGPLGAATTQKMCFPKNKNFKEPPEKDLPNCKTDFQTSGKKTTFKSVCKDADGTLTSSGVGEELGPNHYRNEVTITHEMRGQSRMQQRQVGVVKRIGTACDPNSMFEGMKGFGPQGGAMPNYGGGAAGPASGAMTEQPAARAGAMPKPAEENNPVAKEPKTASNGDNEKESAGNSSNRPGIDTAVEAGKSILKGLLKF